jgi:16S rRNA (uracil1498-N3)-methyltransferase
MQLFYTEQIDEKISLSNEENKHIVKVLRKNVGDKINIINGKGFLFIAEIEEIKKNTVSLKVIKKEKKEKQHKYNLHLAIAPTKNINRFEWFLEKATEIGINEITPIICSRSERKKINLERCDKIIISAVKQSMKFYKPKLNSPISFIDFIDKEYPGEKYIAHCLNQKKYKIIKSEKLSHLILIGPEGDFSENEISLAINKKFKPATLGNSRLRTETAGVVATQTLNLLFE